MADFKFSKTFCVFCDMGHAPITDGDSRFHVMQALVIDADDNVKSHDKRVTCFAQEKDQ